MRIPAETAPAGAALLATAGAAFLGTGLHPVWWLVWIAPIPALLYTYRVPALPGAIVAFSGWLLGSANMLGYYRSAYRVPWPVIGVVSVILAAGFALAVALSGSFVRRGARWSGVLAFPVAWVTFELLLSRVSPHGTLWNLAYTQIDLLPLLQLASVTGLWGISFVVTLAAAAAAAALSTRASWILLAAAGFVALVLAGGALRLSRPAPSETTVRVGLAAWDRPPIFPVESADIRPLVAGYLPVIDRLAADGATVIVLPELIALLTPDDPARLLETFARAAEHNRILLVVGVNQAAEPQDHDLALVFGPDGKLVARYDKHHLIPGLEDHYRHGAELVLLGPAGPRWGVQICKDLDFTGLTSDYADRGTGLVLAPAWDKVQDGWLHSRMAVMRGVEQGLAVARAAKEGALTVSDSRGRILAEARSEAGAVTSTAVDVPIATPNTIYHRVGDAFGWSCAGLLLVLLVLRFRSGTPLGPAGRAQR